MEKALRVVCFTALACFTAFFFTTNSATAAQSTITDTSQEIKKPLITSGLPAHVKGVRGRVESKHKAVLSSALAGKVKAVAGSVGDRVGEGSELITFDCDHQKATLAHSKAELRGAKARLASVESLLAHQSIGPLELELAQSEFDKAQAQLSASQVGIDGCVVVAPFDLVISERFAHPHQSAAKGDPLLEIYQPEHLEVRWLAPSDMFRSLEVGMTFSIFIDELQQSYSGEIKRLGALVDPVSQTVDIFGDLSVENALFPLPGMSGWVQMIDSVELANE